MENDRELFSSRLLNQGLAVWFDPSKDGNCQFSALCNQLNQVNKGKKSSRSEIKPTKEAKGIITEAPKANGHARPPPTRSPISRAD